LVGADGGVVSPPPRSVFEPPESVRVPPGSGRIQS
jgi:hypothetical protein